MKTILTVNTRTAVALASLLIANGVQAQTAPATEVVAFLAPVTVAASRGQARVEAMPLNTTIVSQADIQKSSAQTLDQLLRDVAGMNFTGVPTPQTDPTGHQTKMRGMGNAKVLVLLDGVPIHDPFYLTTQWFKIPLSNIERVEVVRGGNSSLWGNMAVAGVVNIVSKRAADNAGEASFSAGSSGTMSGAFSKNFAVSDALSFNLTLDRLNSRGYTMVLANQLWRTPARDPVNAQDTNAQLTASAVRGQHVAGQSGVARLDALGPGDVTNKLVSRLDLDRRAVAAQGCCAGPRNDPEPGIRHENPAERHQISCARVLAGSVETDRILVARVTESEPPGGSVHQCYEAWHGPRDCDCEGYRRVVSAQQHQPVEQIPNRKLLPGLDAHEGLPGTRLVPDGGDDLVEPEPLHGKVGGHHLRGAGHRKAPVRRLPRKGLPGAGINQQPGAGVQLRGASRAGGRPRERDQPEGECHRDRRGGDQPQRSFSFCPGMIACGSRPGFSSSIVSTGTPVFSAIAVSESPSWTS